MRKLPSVEEVKAAVVNASGNLTQAARDLGIHRDTVRKVIRDNPIEVQAEIPTQVERKVVLRPSVRVRATTDDFDDWTVVGIGDFHSSPEYSNERARWIGRYAADRLGSAKTKTALVNIGDWGTFDSLSGFEQPGSLSQKQRPTFQSDLECIAESRGLMDDGLGGCVPDIKHSTMGNHDCPIYGRPAKRENQIAEHAGLFSGPVENIEASFGWTWSPLGTMYYIGGVAFVHAPLTGMGKEISGVNVADAVARQAMNDVVFGHTHKGGIAKRGKIGRQTGVTALDLGCSLPQGEYEHYIRTNQASEWWWGVHLIHISGGRIVSIEQITMSELERRYK